MEPSSEIWQHVKTGGLYTVLIDDAMIEATAGYAVVYKSLWDGQIWVRPHAEFYDGRFLNIGVEDVTDVRSEEDRNEVA